MSSAELDYNPPPMPSITYNTPPALIAFTLTILILCFVAFTIVYMCKFCFASVIHTWAFTRTASGSLVRLSPERPPPLGLDPTLLEGFPTFCYASVKDHHKKSYSLECAICLLEFEDDSMLRHLTICWHIFHKECIDLWLSSHKTCPVCRTDLESPPPKSGDNNNSQEGMMSLTSDDIRIDVREGECNEVGESVGDQGHECESSYMSMSTIMQQQDDEHKHARAHSTGHSIVMIRGGGDEERDYDKYTLRLPEHVIRGKHNCTRSCVNYNEMTEAAPCSNCGFFQPVTVTGSSSHSLAQQS